MKRSTQIGLAAVGVVLVAAIWSSRDGDAKGDVAYGSIEECKADGQVSAQQCETLFGEAAAKRLAEAPKFQNQQSCEAQYGANGCSAARIGGVEYFLPALAGFMLARSLSGGGQPQAAPLLPPTREACPPGSQAQECQQARSSSSGSGGSGGSRGSGSSRAYSTTSGSALVARSGGSTSGGVSAPSVSSRGGFGSTSSSYHSSSSS